jgi:50S ribosomal subunit-associated GTPase HflX
VPRIEVYNKTDRLSRDECRRLVEADPSALLISAATGAGCEALLTSVAARLALDQQRVHLTLNLAHAADRERLQWAYRHGAVQSQTSSGDVVELDVDVPRRLVAQVDASADTPRRRPGATRR